MADAPAWVTLTAVVITGVLSVAGNQALEWYKARAAREAAETKARRDYEYEARKRLYTEAEPVLFQLYENAQAALWRIVNIAKATLFDHLGEKGWLSDDYYRFSTIYRLLLPLATFRLLRERVTLLDLSLDPDLERRYELGRAAYRAFEGDFFLAEKEPRLPYDPDPDSRVDSVSDPNALIRQGVVTGELERSAEALIVGSGSDARLMKYVEFVDAFEPHDSRLREDVADFADLFDDGFTPMARRVLWRILVAQYFVYHAILSVRDRSLATADVMSQVGSLGVRGLVYSEDPAEKVHIESAARVGRAYLAATLEHLPRGRSESARR